MKASVMLLVLAMANVAVAQQERAAAQGQTPVVPATNIVTREVAPTYTDLYCAGFITNQPLQTRGYVAGGWGTPHVVRFSSGDYVYLQGSTFSVGALYSIVRQERDPNLYEPFNGQHAMMRQLGKNYSDVGRVRVISVRDNLAITQVEFNCTDVMEGDAAIPFVERSSPAIRQQVSFDRFAPANGKLTGRIVLIKDFDTMAGTGRKLYLNVGSNQGVKAGDYFRAVRTYSSYRDDEAENLSFKASAYDDMQIPAGVFPYSRLREFPRMSLGEMVVLSVTPTSSTAMVTLALQDIHLGDGVELEDAPAAGEAEPVPSPKPQVAKQAGQDPAAPPQPPVIACSAEPAVVHAGESSTISCETSSGDERPLSISFKTASGRLVQRENSAVLDTRDLPPGPTEVLATVTDDRDLTATARTTVNIDAARAALAPAKLNYVSFKRNSARVDNAGKAVLDGIALRMQRDADSSLVVLGQVEPGETKELAERRAASTAAYLTAEKGIDQKRLQLQNGGEYGDKADLWLVPPGTRLQEADLKQH